MDPRSAATRSSLVATCSWDPARCAHQLHWFTELNATTCRQRLVDISDRCRQVVANMELFDWPDDFLTKKRGLGYPQCLDGRVAETEHGVRYFEGVVTDGYLQRRGPTPGYSVVVFRGRHVGDPQSLTPAELAAFWTEVSVVARAIESVYAPIHLNFQILGNQDPHVHVHIVARLDPDPAPSMPLPAAA
jgi:diadenosine tetraphosphate (Ap4A) HIT family hydrolase